ncbi:hypothetical protein, partial [Shigella sonnei]
PLRENSSGFSAFGKIPARHFLPGGLLIKGHGLNKPQKSTAGWLVARVSLMLAYAKTWHLKE